MRSAPVIGSNPRLMLDEASERVLTKTWLGLRRKELVEYLREFHAQEPSAAGAHMSAARQGIEPALFSIVIAHFSAVRVQGDLIALSSHTVEYSDDESRALQKIEDAFRAGGFTPPTGFRKFCHP